MCDRPLWRFWDGFYFFMRCKGSHQVDPLGLPIQVWEDYIIQEMIWNNCFSYNLGSEKKEKSF